MAPNDPPDPDDPGGTPDPFGDQNPFANVPIFGDLARMLQQQGAVSWDMARQFALSVATGGTPEANVEPVERIRLEELARVAELHVAKATGLDPSPSGQGVTVQPVNRSQWCQATMDAYRPLFDVLAESLGDEDDDQPVSPDDPFGALAPLLKMMGPMMLGLTAGSMVGHLAQRAFGQYDLPIPRVSGDRILVCVPNLDAFGEEWSLPPEDLRLWVCLHEVTLHAVLGVGHVRAQLDRDLRTYMGGFQPDPSRLESMLGGFEMGDVGGPDAFNQALADPEVVLGAVRSPAQLEMLPRLAGLVAVVVGYVDHAMDTMGAGLLTEYGMLSEALRRRRVEASAADRFVEQLFGLELTQAAYDRGAAFVDGVVERAGEPGLARLWHSARELPTPAEVDAPGLWLARIDLPEA